MSYCHIHSWVGKPANRAGAFAGSTDTAPLCPYPVPPPGDPPSSFPAWNTCCPDRRKRSKNMTRTTIPVLRIRNWIPVFLSTAIMITLTNSSAKMVDVITTESMKSKPWQVLEEFLKRIFVNHKVANLSSKQLGKKQCNFSFFFSKFASGLEKVWFLIDWPLLFRGNDVEPNQ